MTDLVSLYGRNTVGASPYSFSLFSLSGALPKDDPILNINPLDLSDIDAGVQLLYAITQARPGVTWGELLSESKDRLAGIGDWFKDSGKWIGQGVSDIGDKLGEWGGDTIRLLSDKEVRSAVQSYGAAYATGGASLGAEGMLQEMGGSKEGGFNLQSILDMLKGLGKDSKKGVNKAGTDFDFSDIPPKVWAISGGILGGLLLILLVAKK